MYAFYYVDDESLSIRYDGQEIIFTSHELDGWAGMTRIRDAFVKLANAQGARTIIVGDPNV